MAKVTVTIDILGVTVAALKEAIVLQDVMESGADDAITDVNVQPYHIMQMFLNTWEIGLYSGILSGQEFKEDEN